MAKKTKKPQLNYYRDQTPKTNMLAIINTENIKQGRSMQCVSCYKMLKTQKELMDHWIKDHDEIIRFVLRNKFRIDF